MSGRTLYSITNDIEEQLTALSRARSVLCAATEPLECKDPFKTEDGYELVPTEHIMNLLHVTDILLFGTYQELDKAVKSLYSMRKKQNITESQTEEGGVACQEKH